MKIESVGIEKLIDNLRSSAWLVPSFQRDFVWSEGDVVNLVGSIIDSRPIGMATLWEQPDETALDLDAINIPDRPLPDGTPGFARFSDPDNRPNKVFAILDGRQRCTAIAMAFGGFRAQDSRRKFSGRFFLNVAAHDPLHRILYIKDPEIRQRQLEREANCIAAGLFPLASHIEGEPVFEQWMRYLQAIHKPEFYADGMLPLPEELERRDQILKSAFSGINKTLLAVYIVPQTYALGEICEIFETLNTTGTKVSTVDLIHSWLYTETTRQGQQPVSLRDWIDELGQLSGAVGWANREDRPELIAQLVTACYIARGDEKPAPRRVGRKQISSIGSVKAGDLLATPTEHWQEVIAKTDRFAEFIGDFQKCVGQGYFPYSQSPYPVSSAIYVATRWHMQFDSDYRAKWTLAELDALYRAFFWRNALLNRYDQGFLTQLGTDLREVLQRLGERPSYSSTNAWASGVEAWLDSYLDGALPTREQLIDILTDGKPGGAKFKALTLPLVASVRKDLLDPNFDLSYPTDSQVDLHHIYPRQWANDNRHGALAQSLDPTLAGRDYINSIANLMPLSRESNQRWKARLPGRALTDAHITFESASTRFREVLIDQDCYELLTSAVPNPKAFWDRRAAQIADYLLALCRVSVR